MSETKEFSVKNLFKDVQAVISESPYKIGTPDAPCYSAVMAMTSFAKLDPAFAQKRNLYTILSHTVAETCGKYHATPPDITLRIDADAYEHQFTKLKTRLGVS